MYKERKKRLQNRIAESRFSLMVTSLVCLAVWLTAGLVVTSGSWDIGGLPEHPVSLLRSPMLLTLPCLMLSAYMMVELNNYNVLIRVYSRMVSCVFLVLCTMTALYFDSPRLSVTTLCAIGFYSSAFRCYQDRQATGRMYFAFLCVGIASVFFIQVLFFVPLLWVLTTFQLMAMNLRGFCASLLGILTPYWFLLGYHAGMGSMDTFVCHFTEIARFAPVPSLETLNLTQIVTASFVILCAAIGGVHFALTRMNDHIRTQILYEIFITVDIFTILFLLLQPQHFEMLLGIAIVNTTPLIAHFIALTRSKWTNLLTIALLLAATAITVINLWGPSPRF